MNQKANNAKKDTMPGADKTVSAPAPRAAERVLLSSKKVGDEYTLGGRKYRITAVSKKRVAVMGLEDYDIDKGEGNIVVGQRGISRETLPASTIIS